MRLVLLSAKFTEVREYELVLLLSAELEGLEVVLEVFPEDDIELARMDAGLWLYILSVAILELPVFEESADLFGGSTWLNRSDCVEKGLLADFELCCWGVGPFSELWLLDPP